MTALNKVQNSNKLLQRDNGRHMTSGLSGHWENLAVLSNKSIPEQF